MALEALRHEDLGLAELTGLQTQIPSISAFAGAEHLFTDCVGDAEHD